MDKKEIIEAYIYDVTRRLPQESRDEVAKELEANIYDMLEENDSIETVLMELGHPSKLATQYRDQPRYLISPDVFEDYFDTLKKLPYIMVPIGITYFLIVGFLLSNAYANITALGQLVGKSIGVMMNVGFWGALLITVVFVCIDYKIIQKPGKDWSIQNLPKVKQKTTKQIKRIETIFGMVGMSIFFILLVLYLRESTEMHIWFTTSEFDGEFVNFNITYLSQFLPWFTLIYIIGMGTSVLKLIEEQYTNKLLIITFINNVLICVMIYFLLIGGADSIFDAEGIRSIARLTSQTTHDITNIMSSIYRFTFGIAIIASIGEVVYYFYQANKNKFTCS